MAQFHAQNRGLHFVEPAVPTPLGAQILRCLPVIAQGAQTPGQLFIVGDDHSGVTVRPQILTGVKTQATEASHRACLPPLVCCAERLRVVFDDGEAVLFRHGQNWIHVRREAKQMNGYNGAGARRDLRFNMLGIEIERGGFDVRKHRPGAERADGAARWQ